MQVLVRDNNVDHVLRVLRKKMQSEGLSRAQEESFCRRWISVN
ncbi:30S ribosomal protein S21 [Shinella sp. WSJ-2]|nr:30S ribosomal protein S21 [Shinella sp. WSJ-2]